MITPTIRAPDWCFDVHSELLLRVLSKMHSIFPAGTLVTLMVRGDRLHAVAVDAKYLFRASVPINSDLPGTEYAPTSVALQLLHDLLKTGVGTWSFVYTDGELSVRFNKGKYQIATMKDTHPVPDDTGPRSVVWRLPGRDLVQLLKDAAIAAGDQVQRGVYLHADGDCICAVATDGLRISCARYPYSHAHDSDREVVGAIISKDLCGALVRWFEQTEVQVGISSAHRPVDLWWEGDGVTYHLRTSTMQYRFPDYRSVIPVGGQRIVVDGAELAAALGRVGLFAQDKTRRVLLEPGDGVLTVKTASLDLGSAIESIPATCSPGARPWYVDSRNLTDVLARGQVVLHGEAGGVVRVHTRDDRIYVFMSILG